MLQGHWRLESGAAVAQICQEIERAFIELYAHLRFLFSISGNKYYLP